MSATLWDDQFRWMVMNAGQDIPMSLSTGVGVAVFRSSLDRVLRRTLAVVAQSNQRDRVSLSIGTE